MRNTSYKKMFILGIIIILIGTSILPTINAKKNYYEIDEKENNSSIEIKDQDTSSVTMYAFEETTTKEIKIEISTEDAEALYNLFKELKQEIIQDPYSSKAQELRNKFVNLLDEKNMLPKGVTNSKFISLLSPPTLNQPQNNRVYNLKKTMINPLFNRITKILDNKFNDMDPSVGSFDMSATANFCTIASYGDGYTIPVMIPPRPRIGIIWNASMSQTYAGEVFSNKGFYATGAQSGSTVGFTGGGGTFAFPWAKFYVVVGYTWHVKVYADHIDFFPPNYEPEISDLNPPNKAVDVPVSLSELSFKLYDVEGAPMDYKVTTYPDIGSGEGKGKPNGQYSIPVSNLDGSTTYTWTIQVSDDKNNIEKSFTFTTELENPIVSDPSPSDGETWVSTDITKLSFKIYDPQHDPMDYTVETTPDIGSDSATGVSDGTYTCDISNLEYTTIYKWYINVTDGEHITHKTYSFKTEPIMIFDPFSKGWTYRKKITINHTQVAENLEDFPVLISIVDDDLKNKTQNDGDDILFMDGIGVANLLFHEIENYDSTTGELVAWVNIKSLSSVDDTIIYLYYGNNGCNSQQIPEKVWDSNYAAVIHMIDATTSTVNDSTSHYNKGYKYTANDPIESEQGIIDRCQQHNSNNNYIRLYDHSSIDIGTGDATMEIWCKSTSNNIESFYYTENVDNNKIEFMKHEDNYDCAPVIFLRGNNEESTVRGSTSLNDGEWHYVVGTIDNSQAGYSDDLRLFVDGNEETISYELHNWDGTTLSNSNDKWVGKRKNVNKPFQGFLDEFRLSKYERSDAWIKTSFNTMNDPSSFFSIGPEVTAP